MFAKLGRLGHTHLRIGVASVVALAGCRSVDAQRVPAPAVPGDAALVVRAPRPRPSEPTAPVPAGPLGGSCALVSSGASVAPIVIADDAPRVVELAAHELRHYLEKITGAKVRVLRERQLTSQEAAGDLVLVGESERTRSVNLRSESFRTQEYLVRNVGRWLILMGRDDEERGPVDYQSPTLLGDARFDAYAGIAFRLLGTFYAVDAFLESSLGVRWYMPGELGEVAPTLKDIQAKDINLLRRPWTRYRAVGSVSSWDPADFYVPGRTPKRRLPAREMMLWWLRMKMGGEAWYAGHSVGSYAARFGAEHPDWFANGQPKPGAHLCYDKPAFVTQHVQDARDYFDGKLAAGRFPTGGAVPAAGDFYAAMPADSSSGWCADAPKGPEPDLTIPGAEFFNGRSSAYVWSFANQVARELHRTHPSEKISAAAYASYFQPPPNFALEPNVAVTVARNVLLTTNARAKAYLDDGLERWRKQTSDLYVWDYLLAQHFEKFGSFPWIAPHVVAEDVATLRRVGVRGAFVETSPWQSGRANPAEDLLNVYVLARLLADESESVEALLDDHYARFYGAAAVPMKAFFSSIESDWRTHPEVLPGRTGRDAWELFATKEKIAEYRALFDKAAQLAPAAPFAARVALMKSAVLEPIESHALRLAEDRAPRRRLACAKVAEPPVVDGRLNDAAWARAERTTPFTSTTVGGAIHGTSARVVRDERSLYIALEAASLAKGETLEVDIDVERARGDVHRLAVTPDGKVRALLVTDGAVKEWNPELHSASQVAGDRWSAELAIPLSALGAKPGPPVWGFNVARVTDAAASARRSAWSPRLEARRVANTMGLLDFTTTSTRTTTTTLARFEWEEPIAPTGLPISTGAESAVAKLKNEAGGVPWAAGHRALGKFDGGLAFSKSERRYVDVTLPAESAIRRDDWSVGAWVQFARPTSGMLLVSTTSSPAWYLAVRQGAKGPELSFSFAAGVPASSAVTGAVPSLFDGGWHRLAVAVSRGAEAILYADGVRVGSIDISGHRDSLKPTFTVGGPYEFIDGVVDSVRLYKGALSREQLDAAMAK